MNAVIKPIITVSAQEQYCRGAKLLKSESFSGTQDMLFGLIRGAKLNIDCDSSIAVQGYGPQYVHYLFGGKGNSGVSYPPKNSFWYKEGEEFNQQVSMTIFNDALQILQGSKTNLHPQQYKGGALVLSGNGQYLADYQDTILKSLSKKQVTALKKLSKEHFTTDKLLDMLDNVEGRINAYNYKVAIATDGVGYGAITNASKAHYYKKCSVTEKPDYLKIGQLKSDDVGPNIKYILGLDSFSDYNGFNIEYISTGQTVYELTVDDSSERTLTLFEKHDYDQQTGMITYGYDVIYCENFYE